jgi:hypothetical protein
MRNRNKRLLIVLTTWVPCVALAGAASLFVMGPQMRRVRDLNAQLGEARRLYDVARIAANPEAQNHLAEAAEELSRRVSDFVVPSQGADNLAFGIVQIANQTGVESFSMRPRIKQGLEPVPDCNHIGERQIDVSFIASFPAFAGFLNAMERHHPALFVETFAILHSQLQSTQPQVTMQLVLFVEKPQGGNAGPAIGRVLGRTESATKICMGRPSGIEAPDRPGPRKET